MISQEYQAVSHNLTESAFGNALNGISPKPAIWVGLENKQNYLGE